MRGRTVRTAEKGEKLLAKLSQGYSVTAACKAEGIGRRTYYDWRDTDPAFAAAADAAIEAGTDTLEDALLRRAKRDDTTAAIFLLKARRPEKYRERNETRHTGHDGGPLAVTVIRHHAPPEVDE